MRLGGQIKAGQGKSGEWGERRVLARQRKSLEKRAQGKEGFSKFQEPKSVARGRSGREGHRKRSHAVGAIDRISIT